VTGALESRSKDLSSSLSYPEHPLREWTLQDYPPTSPTSLRLRRCTEHDSQRVEQNKGLNIPPIFWVPILTHCFTTVFIQVALIAINIVFFLAGIGILSIGLWLRIDQTLNRFTDEESLQEFQSALYTAAYLLIAFGAFTFLVGMTGCCGALCESKVWLAGFKQDFPAVHSCRPLTCTKSPFKMVVRQCPSSRPSRWFNRLSIPIESKAD